jgi:hypothetical protein
MLLTFASPPQLVEWFHREDRVHDVMCFFLGVSELHLNLLNNIADQVRKFDAAMGEKIAFVLFDNVEPSLMTMEEGQGHKIYYFGQPLINGSTSTSLVTPLRDLNDNISPERIRDGAAKVFTDFRQFLGVKYEELPVLVVMVKGIPESYVICLESNISDELICKWLAKICESAWSDQNTTQLLLTLEPLFQSALFELKGLQDDIKHIRGRITNKLDILLKNQNAIENDWSAVEKYMCDEDFSQESFTALLSSMSFCNSISTRGFKKIRALLHRADILQKKIESRLSFLQDNDNLETRIRKIEDRREKILSIIQDWKQQACPPKAVYFFANQNFLDKSIELSNLLENWGRIGQKLWSFLRVLKSIVEF